MSRFLILTALACAVSQTARATINASLQMQLGNPSGATTDTNNHNHYLIERTVEALDYSDHLGEPVWASWDLTSGDVGSATRSSTYYTDTNLPADFYHVTTEDYNGVGAIDFNRGHLCPSEDRTDNRQDNDTVFLMSNIMPQSGPNNQGVWANLEDDCRTWASQGNELLILCGPSGFGAAKLPSGKAYIPSNVWKIVVVVPLGAGTALSRLTASNRVVAVSIPNVTNGLSSAWTNYLTTASRIEQDTGFGFFSAVPNEIAAVYRARIDGAPKPGITNFSPVAGETGGSVVISGANFTGAAAVLFNGTNASFVLNSAGQITATVPAGAGSGPISVIAAGGLAVSASSFTVTAPAPPAIQSLEFEEGRASLRIDGPVGASYTILTTTNVSDAQWTALVTTNPPAVPFTVIDTNVATQRFYRVRNP